MRAFNSSLGLWSQSGGGENLAGFAITNTHNPACLQRGSMLLVTYLAPPALTETSLVSGMFSYKVKLFCPSESQFDEYCIVNKKYHVAVSGAVVSDVDGVKSTDGVESRESGDSDSPNNDEITSDEHAQEISEAKKDLIYSNTASDRGMCGEKETWVAGRKGDCFVGVLCTQSSRLENGRGKESEVKLSSEKGHTVHMDTRLCDKHRHSWVILVSTTSEYATLEDFVTHRCFNLEVNEINGGGGSSTRHDPYHIEVNDVVEGSVAYGYPNNGKSTSSSSNTSTSGEVNKGSGDNRGGDKQEFYGMLQRSGTM
eukprot:gene31390-38772_t